MYLVFPEEQPKRACSCQMMCISHFNQLSRWFQQCHCAKWVLCLPIFYGYHPRGHLHGLCYHATGMGCSISECPFDMTCCHSVVCVYMALETTAFSPTSWLHLAWTEQMSLYDRLAISVNGCSQRKYLAFCVCTERIVLDGSFFLSVWEKYRIGKHS